jgi:hypothetical protein
LKLHPNELRAPIARFIIHMKEYENDKTFTRYGRDFWKATLPLKSL